MEVSINGGPQTGWFINVYKGKSHENPINMDDLGVPLFINMDDLGVPLFINMDDLGVPLFLGNLYCTW